MALEYLESVNAGDQDSVDWRHKQAKILNTREGTMTYTRVKLQKSLHVTEEVAKCLAIYLFSTPPCLLALSNLVECSSQILRP